MRYGLLFERFLNPGRKSMPDMDIDFAVGGRERVINYVTEKYGRDRVAQIITFSTMMARAAVRDAGRVLEVPYGTVDRIAKMIPEGPKVYLDDNLKPGQELKPAYDADPLVREIVDLAKPLEGLVRADSIHAAGVVIGDRPLIEYVPLQQKGPDSGGRHAVLDGRRRQARPAEDRLPRPAQPRRDRQGGRADRRRSTSRRSRSTTSRPTRCSQKGDAIGVFQFESSGMREALRQVKPTVFEDLIALVALYRPGPMQYIPVYARRKAGQEPVTYIDPRLEAITGDTYGISIYQEQSMEIAKQIGGFSPADADDLRKAIGKKIHSLMASLKEQFIEGCVANGTTKEVAKQLWDDMEKAQDYSFNKSHAAGYALIAYRTAWLRAHHPHEYMAALISSVMSTKDRVPFYVNACHEMGIEVLPPDVNESQVDFAVVEGKIRFGLNAVKNVGEAACRRDRRRARGGRPVRVDLGLHRARRPAGREQARARVARQVRRARLDRRVAQGDGRDARPGALLGRLASTRRAAPGRARSSTSSSRAGEEKPRHHAPIPPEEYEQERAPAPGEGDARPLGQRAPARRDRRRAAAQDRPRRSPTSSAAATARSSPSAESSRRSSS